MRIFEVPAKRIILRSYLTKGSRLFLNKNIFEKCICNEYIFKVLLIVNQTLKGKIVLISTSVMGIKFWADTFLSLLRSLRLG